MEIPKFGPGGKTMTLGRSDDKWSDVIAVNATIDSFKSKGDTSTPIYFDENGVPQEVTSIKVDDSEMKQEIASIKTTVTAFTAGTTAVKEADHAIYADNADEADKLTTARTITLAGDATGSAAFDGSGDVTIDVTVSGGSGGTSGARVIAYVTENTTVTCKSSDGSTIGTKTADSTSQVSFDLGYGTYTFSIPSDIEGVDATTTVEITELKIYNIVLSSDASNCKLTVNAEAGASVTVVNKGISQTKTIADDATSATFSILYSDVESTITATKNGATVTGTATFSSGETTKSVTLTFAKLQVIGAAGQSVVVSKGTYSFSHTFSTDGESYTIYIPSLGTWSVVATDADSNVTSTTANVTAYTTYSVNCSKKIYAFKIDGTVSDPAKMITYLEDCAGYTPAKMNYNTGKFEWGSWSEDEFFMPRPCMLKYDGTVDYYLNPDDYGFRADTGAASDIANTSYGGNAMMEWGRDGKKIWYKIVPTSGNSNTSATVYIADSQVDSDYHAWSFINSSGEMVDHFYTPIYNGSLVSSKLRSLSGQACAVSTTVAQEVQYAEANNPSSKKMWYTEVYADITLINLLLMLIGKSTDTQTTFGWGNAFNMTGSVQNTGQLNTKGLFYGTQEADARGVKVFGMENWWGNIYRRYAGHVTNANYQQLVKLTYGKQDGSTTSGYNTDGTGYISTGVTLSKTSGTSTSGTGGYITQESYSNIFGMVHSGFNSGSASTYYCDYGSCYASCYAYRGGRSDVGCGAFYVDLDGAASASSSVIGAAISCKP